MLYETIKTEAVVIGEKELSEDDKLFSVYTKEFGKIEVLGKAVRKSKAKLRSGLQILNYISLEFVKGKSFNIATDVIIKDEFLQTKRDLKLFRFAFYICNLLDKLISGEEKDKRIWDLLFETLKEINQLSVIFNHLPLVIRYFEWNLLSFLGFEPELYQCVGCGEKIKYGKFFFSAKKGGVLCEKCSNKKDRAFKEISRDAIKILRLIINQDKTILKKLKIIQEQEKELKDFSFYYLSNILEEKIFVI